MSLWNNAPLELYHGTDSQSLRGYSLAIGVPLAGFAVDLRLSRANTDFGQGFYTTTLEQQARNWANLRVRRRKARISNASAVVLSFTIDREWLATLDTLCFVLPSRSFFDLVEDCRAGEPPHQRRGPKAAYDLVFGPVSLWPQDLYVGMGDQVSIHTTSAATGLPTPIVLDIASAPTGLFSRAES